MERFITIQSKGTLIVDDLHLLGGTTKRSDDSKIGMFGSGWKYALAYLFRNNHHIEIYSGKKHININTIPKTYRGMNIDIITINNKETSITTDMGPKWTAWMAVREIVSNAIDEGEFKYSLADTNSIDNISSKEGYTTIHIGGDEIYDIMSNFDDYFAFNKTGGIVLESYGRKATFYLKDKPSTINIYRKGIKCYNSNVLSYFDVNLNNVDINESRLAERYSINSYIVNILDSVSNSNVLLAILNSGYAVFEDESYLNKSTEDSLVDLAENNIFTCNTISKFIGAPYGAIVIPNVWYFTLVSKGIIENKLNIAFGNGIPLGFIEQPATFNVDNISKTLKLFNVDLKIVTGVFMEKYEDVRTTVDAIYIRYDLPIDNEFNDRVSSLLGKIRPSYYLKKLKQLQSSM